MPDNDLTPAQSAMVETWERHTVAEFETKSIDATMATMTAEPVVTIEMPWMLPGVVPTGKHVEVALVVVVDFEGEKISGERIYWDQASVLAQVGLLDAQRLPVTGIEASRKVVDPAREPSNGLIGRARGR